MASQKLKKKAFKDFVGDQFFMDTPIEEVESPFSETELLIIKKVSERFKGKTTKQIVDISHEEPAWKDNVDECNRISFEYGFDLKSIQ